MEQHEYLHVIGVGGSEDWEAGRGTLYYIEDKNGERALPVFTTAEAAGAYVGRTLNTPTAHMEMLESAGLSHAPALTGGRFVLMPLDMDGVAKSVLMVEADYLIRDIRPAAHQEIMRLPKPDPEV